MHSSCSWWEEWQKLPAEAKSWTFQGVFCGCWQSASPFPLLPSCWSEWNSKSNPFSCRGPAAAQINCATSFFFFLHKFLWRDLDSGFMPSPFCLCHPCCSSTLLPDLWHGHWWGTAHISYSQVGPQSWKPVFPLLLFLSLKAICQQEKTTFLLL